MSVWQNLPFAELQGRKSSTLCGSEGELVSVSISVDPRELEALLEALAHVDFPVNPRIYHAEGSCPGACATVEFPAYMGGLEQVQRAVNAAGQDSATIRVRGMLEEIQSVG